jgi:hypothetical protein
VARAQRYGNARGKAGIGRHIAVRLLADGEQVVDVPPKLWARASVSPGSPRSPRPDLATSWRTGPSPRLTSKRALGTDLELLKNALSEFYGPTA